MAQRPLVLRLDEGPPEELALVQRSSLVQLGAAVELWSPAGSRTVALEDVHMNIDRKSVV